MKAKFIAFLILAASCLSVHAQGASAVNFPAKPIKIIVPFPAGGTSDWAKIR
jgi:tripartite-type tricarboxylate transporter receptor subunit TctC